MITIEYKDEKSVRAYDINLSGVYKPNIHDYAHSGYAKKLVMSRLVVCRELGLHHLFVPTDVCNTFNTYDILDGELSIPSDIANLLENVQFIKSEDRIKLV